MGRSGLSRSFHQLWAAQAIDAIGSVLTTVVLSALAILLLHAQAIQIGIMVALRYTATPIAGLVAGRLADLIAPRRLMQTSYFVRAAALATLPAAAATHLLTMGQVYAVATVDGILVAFIQVSFDVVMPRIVPRGDLGKANARVSATNAIGETGGPGAAGIVAQLAGPAGALVGVVVGFVLSGLMLTGMRAPTAASGDDAPGEGGTSRWREAWAELRHNKLLRSLSTTLTLWNAAAGMIEANLILFLFTIGQPIGVIGLVLAVGEAGSFVGLAMVGLVSRRTGIAARLVFLPIMTGIMYGLVPHSVAANVPACGDSISRGHAVGSINQTAAEVQPAVAADPAHPGRAAVIVEQDPWNDGGASALTVMVSSDGGRTWAPPAQQPAFTVCGGAAAGSAGYRDRGGDPSLSAGPDGTLYAAAHVFDVSGGGDLGGRDTIVVSTSADSGDHWRAPVAVATDGSTLVRNDEPSVSADPTTPGRAFIVWRRLEASSADAYARDPNSVAARTMIATTTDGGRSWSAAQTVTDPGGYAQALNTRLAVVAAGPVRGELVATYVLARVRPGSATAIPTSDSTYALTAVTSTDAGRTWSQPHPIATIPHSDVRLTVSGTVDHVRAAGLVPGIAADPHSGDLYAVWQDVRHDAPGVTAIALSRSTDGGATWSTAADVNGGPGAADAFLPQVGVTADGTVGVTYYDLRNASTLHSGLTDLFLTRCAAASHDCTDPANWRETRVTASSFDITTAPASDEFEAGDFFVGDSTGLTAAGDSFIAVYACASPQASHGASDIFSGVVT